MLLMDFMLLRSRALQGQASPRAWLYPCQRNSSSAASSCSRRYSDIRRRSRAAEGCPARPDDGQMGSQPPAPPLADKNTGLIGWLKRRNKGHGEKIATVGLAAVLAYGLLDGFSKAFIFCLAFLAFEARTGLNPTSNWADLVRVYVLMWAAASVTRPLKVAGAAALTPLMDKVLDGIQDWLRLPSRLQAFLLVALSGAGVCIAAVGALFLSRWVGR